MGEGESEAKGMKGMKGKEVGLAQMANCLGFKINKILRVRQHQVHLVSFTLPQLEAAQELLVEAITAGILGDLGSGGSVDACVITATGAQLLRTLSSPTKPVQR